MKSLQALIEDRLRLRPGAAEACAIYGGTTIPQLQAKEVGWRRRLLAIADSLPFDWEVRLQDEPFVTLESEVLFLVLLSLWAQATPDERTQGRLASEKYVYPKLIHRLSGGGPV